MEKDKPNLTIVGKDFNREYEEEFEPLPYYPWDIRPSTVDLPHGEAATAIYLAHGDDHLAAKILKVPYVRLSRLIRGSPRLQRVLEETGGEVVAAAASVAIQTLFDPDADKRRLEWASTKVLQSRIAQGHRFGPAPPANIQSTPAVQHPVVVLWGDGTKVAEIGPRMVSDGDETRLESEGSGAHSSEGSVRGEDSQE